jgi:hypothetical protein
VSAAACRRERKQREFAHPEEGHTSVGGCDRKHWQRLSVNHDGKPWRGNVKFKVKRAERWVVMYPPMSPLKGTVMVGEISRYYEPEWSEQTAWEALQRIVFEHFTDWTEQGFAVTLRFEQHSEGACSSARSHQGDRRESMIALSRRTAHSDNSDLLNAPQSLALIEASLKERINADVCRGIWFPRCSHADRSLVLSRDERHNDHFPVDKLLFVRRDHIYLQSWKRQS